MRAGTPTAKVAGTLNGTSAANAASFPFPSRLLLTGNCRHQNGGGDAKAPNDQRQMQAQSDQRRGDRRSSRRRVHGAEGCHRLLPRAAKVGAVGRRTHWAFQPTRQDSLNQWLRRPCTARPGAATTRSTVTAKRQRDEERYSRCAGASVEARGPLPPWPPIAHSIHRPLTRSRITDQIALPRSVLPGLLQRNRTIDITATTARQAATHSRPIACQKCQRMPARRATSPAPSHAAAAALSAIRRRTPF